MSKLKTFSTPLVKTKSKPFVFKETTFELLDSFLDFYKENHPGHEVDLSLLAENVILQFINSETEFKKFKQRKTASTERNEETKPEQSKTSESKTGSGNGAFTGPGNKEDEDLNLI